MLHSTSVPLYHFRPCADVAGAGRVQGDLPDVVGGAGAAADAPRPHARLHHGLAGREGHPGAAGSRSRYVCRLGFSSYVILHSVTHNTGYS